MIANPLRVARPVREKPLPASGDSHVARVFRTLEALVPAPRTAAEIAGVLGVNRSTALRLLGEMEQLGYVIRDRESKSYAIAPSRFYPFISSGADHLDWSAAVDPVLADLREEFGEASIMGVPANGTMVYLAFFPSAHVITVRERLGTMRPMHCSALGKAYLSALDDRSLDSELGLLNYQGGTKLAAPGPIELRRRLEETRKRGYAIDREETIEGCTCVAIPAAVGGTLVGAIGLSGPSSRINDERVAEMGKRLLQVARRLGGAPR
jgi:DNA-binding IclR family transcriptional regulator